MMQKCDYCLGFAEMEGDPEYCECHTLAQIERNFLARFIVIGAEADWGLGVGVIGVQEFSLYADSERDAESKSFKLAVREQAEELLKNLINIEVQQISHCKK